MKKGLVSRITVDCWLSKGTDLALIIVHLLDISRRGYAI